MYLCEFLRTKGQNIVGIDSTLLLHSQATTSSRGAVESYPPGYLDIVPNARGFNHIAYYSPPDAREPVFLTEGDWEVDGGIQGIDVARGIM